MQSIVEAVDKSKFKSCDQSSFCRLVLDFKIFKVDLDDDDELILSPRFEYPRRIRLTSESNGL